MCLCCSGGGQRSDGSLKIADFGLARSFSKPDANGRQMQRYTGKVVTLWYRSPELLLGMRNYGPAVDIWSTGIIFAELIAKKVFLQANNEIKQLDQIFRWCGSPAAPSTWPGHENLGHYEALQSVCKKPNERDLHNHRNLRGLREGHHGNLPGSNGQAAYDLLDQMLILDPAKRIDAAAALQHQYFADEPFVDLAAIDRSQLNRPAKESKELGTKNDRAKKRPLPNANPKAQQQPGDAAAAAPRNSGLVAPWAKKSATSANAVAGAATASAAGGGGGDGNAAYQHRPGGASGRAGPGGRGGVRGSLPGGRGGASGRGGPRGAARGPSRGGPAAPWGRGAGGARGGGRGAGSGASTGAGPGAWPGAGRPAGR